MHVRPEKSPDFQAETPLMSKGIHGHFDSQPLIDFCRAIADPLSATMIFRF